MKFSDETLMAYADGELDTQMRREIEAAMASDANVARQVARFKATRAELAEAFGGLLDEPLPGRLLDAANCAPAGSRVVTDLSAAREAKAARSEQRRWSWPEWTSMAASLLLGLAAGRTLLFDSNQDLLATRDRSIVAGGALARALDQQVGGASADNSVAVGLSFKARSGEYCRAFATRGGQALAGLACKDGERWQVEAIEQVGERTATDNFRMAATELSPAILQAISARIEGEALDAEQEAAARERGWK